jgi:hypothetical protein
MPLSADCKGALENWKFHNARHCIEERPEGVTMQEVSLIEALEELVGNSGWFDGALGTVVSVAVEMLTGGPDA